MSEHEGFVDEDADMAAYYEHFCGEAERRRTEGSLIWAFCFGILILILCGLGVFGVWR